MQTAPYCAGRRTSSLISSILLLSATVNAGEPPDFAVHLADQSFKAMSWPPATESGVWRLDSSDVSAELAQLPENRWRLRLTAKTNLSQVIFPWPGNEPARALRSPGALYYSLYLLGIARRVDSLQEFEWAGVHYPGACHAPLMVCATDTEAKMVAATNWPPRYVLPNMSGRGMTIVEQRFLAAGQSQTYEILIESFRRDQPGLQPLWTDAIDSYRRWLEPHLQEAGLQPRAVPDWLADAQGWYGVGLQNLTVFRPDEVYRMYNHWKGVFPWIQFWGQMSHYFGPAHLAQPRRAPDEEVGCCIEKIGIHDRYKDGLPGLAARIAQEGHVGFYHRPPDKGNLETRPEHRKFVADWFEWAKQHHADAFYFDVVGNEYYGDALTVAKFLRDETPPATVTEYTMDVYPLPALMSGSQVGGDLKGCARAWRELLAGRRAVAPCPEFGRYLFRDRIIFLGQCNGDHVVWGRANGHWAERQAFLLGAKLDVLNPWDGEDPFGPLNHMVGAIIRERERVKWWARKPVYRHRAGLEYIPPEIDARVFADQQGGMLIACDNPLGLRGMRLRVGGVDVDVPADAISVLEIPRPAP